MNIKNFTLDANNASIVSQEKKTNSEGNTVVRTIFDNGFIWVYTEMPDKSFTKMDFSHELKINGNVYTPDMNSRKKDFNDYFKLI